LNTPLTRTVERIDDELTKDVTKRNKYEERYVVLKKVDDDYEKFNGLFEDAKQEIIRLDKENILVSNGNFAYNFLRRNCTPF
jgi:hypothetical protein